ncbi:unnamed protein product [Thelazia callipaeda]|uniref:Uncharacterized protein n=1 Tax=Thelazia callipaeda TaxID=103827 RepID=A0A0N5CQI8_THECL|nr:unnamed protein product [Thelazia callipaeda]
MSSTSSGSYGTTITAMKSTVNDSMHSSYMIAAKSSEIMPTTSTARHFATSDEDNCNGNSRSNIRGKDNGTTPMDSAPSSSSASTSSSLSSSSSTSSAKANLSNGLGTSGVIPIIESNNGITGKGMEDLGPVSRDRCNTWPMRRAQLDINVQTSPLIHEQILEEETE